jgi:hypothetical protein
VAAVRGGAKGVRTTTNKEVNADSAISLALPNRDLSKRENQPLGSIPDATPAGQCVVGSSEDEIKLLNGVRNALWQAVSWTNLGGPGGPWAPVEDTRITPAFTAIDAAFPHDDTATAATFNIAPSAGSLVLIDSGSGVAPLPIDLLRTDPDGTIQNNPGAFGSAAAGIDTLDGFSTTAMMIAQTSVPVDAGTVNGANVHLFKLDPAGGVPTVVRELKQELGILGAGGPGQPQNAGYVAQPTPIIVPKGGPLAPGLTCPADGGCSPVIGLQPAVRAPTPAGTFYLPPLQESTSYAVVVTKRVKDMLGAPLVINSVTKLLLGSGTIPLYDAGTGTSLVPGVGAATAKALQTMRAELVPVMANLPAGTVAADVVTAYTFKTQSITATSLSIAGIPYGTPGIGAVQAASFFTPAQISASYGIPAAAIPTPPIAEFSEVKLTTLSLLLGSQTGGAFDQAHPTPEVITALVAVPVAPLVTGTCPAGITAAHCAPLVVFRHGIWRSKADMLATAARLTGAGFVVAAIDADKNGDRSWCKADAECCPAAVCGTASTCAFKANLTGPTDDGTPIGVCESAPGVRGSYLNYRLDRAGSEFLPDGVTPDPTAFSPKGIPYISAQFLVSLNFFRTRDTLRQDVIDESSLVKALAPFTDSTDAFAKHLADTYGIAVDPNKIYWFSQSLGSMQGALTTAVNPRITRAVFNVGGATLVDVFANPASSTHEALLDLIAPVEENTPDYLKLLIVAKWILDPAEPANFLGHVRSGDLTSFSPTFPMPTREVLTQIGLCDDLVPNDQNTYFSARLGLSVPAAGASSTGRTTWYLSGATGATCPDNGVTHGFLLDNAIPTLTAQAQTNAASFLAAPADQAATVRP